MLFATAARGVAGPLRESAVLVEHGSVEGYINKKLSDKDRLVATGGGFPSFINFYIPSFINIYGNCFAEQNLGHDMGNNQLQSLNCVRIQSEL